MFAVGSHLTFLYSVSHVLVNASSPPVEEASDGPGIESHGHDKGLTSPPVLSSAVYNEDVAKVYSEDVKTWENYTQYLAPSPFSHLITDASVHLVFSVRNHWHGNLENYSTMVRNVLRYLTNKFNGVQVIFRAIGHGHHGCSTPELQVDFSPQTWGESNFDS